VEQQRGEYHNIPTAKAIQHSSTTRPSNVKTLPLHPAASLPFVPSQICTASPKVQQASPLQETHQQR
jgi:hypothetical protein